MCAAFSLWGRGLLQLIGDPIPQNFWFSRSRVDWKFAISNKFLDNADGPGTTLRGRTTGLGKCCLYLVDSGLALAAITVAWETFQKCWYLLPLPEILTNLLYTQASLCFYSSRMRAAWMAQGVTRLPSAWVTIPGSWGGATCRASYSAERLLLPLLLPLLVHAQTVSNKSS